jgi:hypothetical protein
MKNFFLLGWAIGAIYLISNNVFANNEPIDHLPPGDGGGYSCTVTSNCNDGGSVSCTGVVKCSRTTLSVTCDGNTTYCY